MAATPAPLVRNYKGELGTFLQRFIGRTLTKDDVVYTYTSSGEQFQAVVKLNCSDGEEFAGELCATEKEAGQAAAAQALAAFESAAAALPPAQTRQEKTRERKNKKAQEKGLLGIEGGVKEEKVEGDGGARETNFKTELVKALQVHCKRAMTKLDVIYNTTKVGEWHQATVQLAVVQDATFAGEPCATEKAAEHSAAEQALLGRSGWPDAVPPTTPAEKIALGGDGALAVPGVSGQKRKGGGASREAGNRKSELVIFLQGFVKRTLTKGDVVYTCNRFGSYYQATLTLACLDGQRFDGEPCTTQKEAESSAAEQALLAYAEHVQEVPALRRIAEGGPSPAGGGRGGAAKRQRLQAPWPAFAVSAIRPGRPGGVGVPMFHFASQPPMRAALGDIGLGGVRKGPLAAGPRTAVIGLPISGTVTDWNATGSWGYVRPDVPINHPQAVVKGGKIYVHKQDLANATELPVGSRVQFKVYEDARGLGANDVVVVM